MTGIEFYIKRNKDFDPEDFESNTSYIQYSTFSIWDSTTEYTLSIEGYSGTTGDGLICDEDGSDWNHRNGMKFSAKDNNNNADH